MKLQIGCDVCLKEGVLQMDLEEHRRGAGAAIK
ncbi:hypothetical protein C5167_042569 [Papaver somniferum]|uniref:Uncharacterized protein n=1 Tax=Papaver somniferum TaxID=3469 RepID=A0A4Y7L5X3_PAPSO|nr:hypothetical protein C5167_021083 [Papaver somniferum]RZC73541.1 hypothetical protein C5167_049020 [Papaver somniferum]RZC80000.1 hypothetical protein C5167_042569 [Papaver somniferum]